MKKEIKLTINDKKVLKLLLRNARVSDAETGRQLKVTTQAARKIRKKLEGIGIIKAYTTVLDYEKIGIKAFALVMMRISPEMLDKDSGIMKDPNLISSYRLPRSDISHIGTYAFRDLTELDNYFIQFQRKYGDKVGIHRLYIFSNRSLLRRSSRELFEKIINEM